MIGQKARNSKNILFYVFDILLFKGSKTLLILCVCVTVAL